MAQDSDIRRFSGVQPLPDQLWSDTILSRDASSFTVLSVDRFRGQRRGGPPTSHPYWELVVVLGGAGELVGTTAQSVGRPDVLLIPPGVLHDEIAPVMLDTVWVALGGSRLRSAGGGILAVRDEDLCRLGEELWMQAAVRTERGGGELDGLALTLVGRFLRLHANGPSGDLIDQAVRWLHQHLDRPVQVADLSRHLRISPAHLHRLFKSRTRRSPKAFLNALRLERAAHLLRHTALPSARISALVGFDDPLYFSRAFARATGMPPSRFRAAQSAENSTRSA
jgi:AraC-like DNA-binding protein